MRPHLIAITCLLALPVAACAAHVESISRLAAGPGNILFFADWKEAKIHAIELPPAPPKPAGTAFNILDLETLLSKQVGGARVSVEDMAVRPETTSCPSSAGTSGPWMRTGRRRPRGDCPPCPPHPGNRCA